MEEQRSDLYGKQHTVGFCTFLGYDRFGETAVVRERSIKRCSFVGWCLFLLLKRLA